MINVMILAMIGVLAGMSVFQKEISKVSYLCMCVIAACSTLKLIITG